MVNCWPVVHKTVSSISSTWQLQSYYILSKVHIFEHYSMCYIISLKYFIRSRYAYSCSVFLTRLSNTSISFGWLSHSSSWYVNIPFIVFYIYISFFFRRNRHTAQPTTVGTLSGHSSWVLSVAFSSDNQHLISSYVLRFWLDWNRRLLRSVLG